MKKICTGFSNNVHLRPERKAVLRTVAVIRELYLLNAVDAGSRYSRLLPAFRIEKSVDVAARRVLTVQLDIQARKNILQSVYTPLEKSG